MASHIVKTTDSQEVVTVRPPVALIDPNAEAPRYLPLGAVAEEAVVEALVVAVGGRGNPLLSGKPVDELRVFARTIRRKALAAGMSFVCVVGDGVPVAFNFCWDILDGGVWSETPPPESLVPQAEKAKAFGAGRPAPVPSERGHTLSTILTTVVRPYPGLLGGRCFRLSVEAAHNSGFRRITCMTTHPVTISMFTFFTRVTPKPLQWKVGAAETTPWAEDGLKEKAKGGYFLCTDLHIGSVKWLIRVAEVMEVMLDRFTSGKRRGLRDIEQRMRQFLRAFAVLVIFGLGELSVRRLRLRLRRGKLALR